MNVTKVILYLEPSLFRAGDFTHQKTRTLSEGLFCLRRQHILHNNTEVEGSDEALYVPYHMSYTRATMRAMLLYENYISDEHIHIIF